MNDAVLEELKSAQHLLLIDGETRPTASGAATSVVNPATGEELAKVHLAEPEDIDAAVAAAKRAFEEGPWPRMRAFERGQILTKIAGRIREDADRLAAIESADVGKTLEEGLRDVEAAARYFEFYAGAADKVHGDTIPVADHLLDFTLQEPIGVSGQIIPFNYPLQNTARGAAPALAVGCTVVLKPSPECPLTPLYIGQIALECGVPAGVFNVVPGDRPAGARLTENPDVNQITFTGSVATGIAVAQSAAKNVVPTTLELGGKSPTIVFGDADFELAANGIIASAFGNAGQTCAAGTRLLLERGDRGDEFLAYLVERAQQLRVGPGLQNPDVGPLVSDRQFKKVLSYLDRAREDSEGRVHLGGNRVSDVELEGGYFVQPTIFEAPGNDHALAQEEIFGPVLTVVRFDSAQDAIKIANDTDYGLSSYVWTQDVNKALLMGKSIRAGQVNINTFNVGTGIEMPFGGFKHSGWGREKGLEGIKSYLQVKNVCIGVKQ